MGKRYLVTCGLPYSNNRLHVGHIAGAYLPADTYVRYRRARGDEVCFICGSDDNGVAIEISARQQSTTPAEISARYHASQQRSFAGLGIEFDIYGGTHQPGFVAIHEQLSQEFFLRIHEKGYFTKKRSKQLYDPQAERFLPDRYVRGTCHHCDTPGANGDQCDACGQMIDPLLLKDPVSTLTPGQPAEVRETTHWYLKLSDFEIMLKRWLESKEGQWRPQVLNFALGQIKQGLPERAMTRDIDWGIPVPLDDPEAAGKVLFVWFDAPIGYISFTAALCQQRAGGQDYDYWWASEDSDIVHFIGEDNTVFHALIWPAMLMADERFQLPAQVVANNFLNFRVAGEFKKISKSETSPDSPVWIEEYLKRFEPDPLRYHLTAVAPETNRTAFDPAEFVQRNNNELVATFGNFINRFMTAFVHKHYGGQVPEATLAESDRALLARGEEALQRVGALIEKFQFRAALEEMMGFARAGNEYFNEQEPWKTRKSEPERCAAAITTCIHAARYLGVLADPFMPHAAQTLRAMVWPEAGETVTWAAPPAPEAGRPLGAAEILFEKLEPDAMEA
jgi:methionyl-tRNA synthetase